GRMEQCGLVARQPCADDARGALISLTQQGQTTLHQAAPPHVGSVRRHMIDLLTADEVAALDTIAAKVIIHLAGHVPTDLPPRYPSNGLPRTAAAPPPRRPAPPRQPGEALAGTGLALANPPRHGTALAAADQIWTRHGRRNPPWHDWRAR